MSKFNILNNVVPPDAIELTSNLYLSVFKLVLFGMLSNDSTNTNFDLHTKNVEGALTQYYKKSKLISKDFKAFYQIKNAKDIDIKLFSSTFISPSTDLAVISKIASYINDSNVDLSKLKKDKKIHDVLNVTALLTNTLLVSSLEYSPSIVKSILQDHLVNSPQWWVITVNDNFSMKSIKHSINVIHTSADNTKQVKANLANGSAALCPTNLTLGFIIDILGKNKPLNKIMIPRVTKSFTNIGQRIDGVVEANNLQYFDKYNTFFKALNHMDLHIKATAVTGYIGFMNPYQFNHTYFFFWRYNAMSLRNKIFTTSFIQQKNKNFDILISKYITKEKK